MVTEDGRGRTFCYFYGSWAVPSGKKGQNNAKNNIKAKQNSSRPNSPKRPKKVPKCQLPNQNFQGQTPSKKPNLTYLALHKAKWEPWAKTVSPVLDRSSPNLEHNGRSNDETFSFRKCKMAAGGHPRHISHNFRTGLPVGAMLFF